MVSILVVDDEADVEALITQKFRKKVRKGEWDIRFARDGEEALEVLHKNDDIDIVLSDINMPRMDGLTLTQKIKEQGLDLRAIVVSAYSDIKNIRSAMNNGAFDFITKPINFEDMESTIQRGFDNLSNMREATRSRDDLLAIRKELNLAEAIQQSILPTDFNIEPRCPLYASMTPAKQVGGDFYDFFKLDDDRLVLLVADVSGKGIPAALYAMVNQTLSRSLSYSLSSPSPSRVANMLNTECCKNNDACMFTTLFYCILDLKTGELTYANAGHNAPLQIDPDSSCKVLPLTDGTPLGVMEDQEYVEKKTTLKPGSLLFIYTDGVTESMNAAGEEYGEARLIDVLRASADKDLAVIDEQVHGTVNEFIGDEPQFDDLTYLAIKYQPKP